MTKKTLFIADLHLDVTQPNITKLFLQFIEHYAAAIDVDALYILGDLFRLWAGDDDDSEFNQQIKAALKKLSQTMTVYLMPGNRDFLLGEKFARASGCILIPDPYKIDLYGTPTLLSHGDVLCTKDLTHILFRQLTRRKFGLKLFSQLPLKWRKFLAEKIHEWTTKTKNKKSSTVIATQQQAIEDVMTQFNVQQLIQGHTHKQLMEHLEFKNNNHVKYFVLGEWLESSSILIFDSAGNFKFETM